MADLELSRSRILNVWSIILKFTLTIFYLIKSDSRTKKSLKELPYIALSKGTIFAKKCLLYAKTLTLVGNVF